jgi:hypothetical protein
MTENQFSGDRVSESPVAPESTSARTVKPITEVASAKMADVAKARRGDRLSTAPELHELSQTIVHARATDLLDAKQADAARARPGDALSETPLAP